MFTLKRTDETNPDFLSLVELLDQDLATRDGDEHAFYAALNKLHNIKHVVVCYNEGEAIGCGSFKPFDKEQVEIKRMFVKPTNRGKGIALRVLHELETWAASLNYKACILETGKKQPEAIRLYEKAGYAYIKNFGNYENIENSVCMRKPINVI